DSGTSNFDSQRARPKPRPVTKKSANANQGPDDAFSLRKRVQSCTTDPDPISAPSSKLLAAEEGHSCGSPDVSCPWEILLAQRNPSGASSDGSAIPQQEPPTVQSEYDPYPLQQPTTHYERDPYLPWYPPPRGIAEHLTGPGMPTRGMQGDMYCQQHDGCGDYNDRMQYPSGGWYGPRGPDPRLQPYAGAFPLMGAPYPQFQAPYAEMENSWAPPSALLPQGDSQAHGGYVNPIPAYGEMSGYYYRGQPNSQFRPTPAICRSPYPEAAGQPNPSAYSNPPA
ncbi:hypothetical protein HYDPIDRAFT_33278, partial [Hydnomerulius pinastri MD-312]